MGGPQASPTNLIIYDGIISGTGGLTKAGTGILALTGNANASRLTYTGPTVVSAGTLRVRTNSNVLPTGTALTIGSAGTFDVSSLSQRVGSTSGSGTLSLSTGTFTTGDATSTTFSGVITGTTGTLVKDGAGTFTVSGANTYSGATTVNAGTLMLGSSSGLGFGGTLTTRAGTSVTAGATIDLNGITGVNEVLTLNGTGVGGNGAIINSNTTAQAVLSDGVATGPSAASLPTTAGASTAITVTGGGGGTGAAATGSVGLTSASFTVDSGTQVYSAAPTVTVSGNGVATAVLTNGLVTGVTVTTVGSGYSMSTAPTITFSGGTVSQAGTAPTGVGNTANYRLAGITITDPGSGYTSAPTFTSGTVTVTPTLSSIALGSASSVGGAGDLQIASVVSGAAANTLTKVGAGTLVLSGANTYAGNTTVSAGVLEARSNAALGTTAGTTTVAAGAALRINGSGLATGEALTINGTGISGTGAVRNLANSNSLSGAVTLGSDARINSDSGTLTIGTSGNAAITGTTQAVTLGGAGNTTVAGNITTTTGGLTKDGSGTLTLAGTNTYTGATSVTAGTLNVSGSVANSAVGVTQSGIVAGTGTAGASLSVSAAGTVSPGTSPGSLSTGALEFGSTGNYNWQIRDAAGTAGTGYDTINAATLDITSTVTNKFAVNVWSLASTGPDQNGPAAFNSSQAYTWTLVHTTGGVTGYSADKFQVNTASANGTGGFANALDGGVFAVGLSGNDLVLSFTPTPEPGTVLGVAAAGLGLARWVRRRRAAAA